MPGFTRGFKVDTLLALIGWIIYHQSLNSAAIIGITLISAGVIVLMLFSKTALD